MTKLALSQSQSLRWLSVFCILTAFPAGEVSAEEKDKRASMEVSVCLPVTIGFQGISKDEEVRIQRIARARAEALRRANAWPTEHVKISDNMKHPNSVKIPFSQAPGISAETREENGRRVCAHKKDKGNKSKQKDKDVHIDRECCLDPDEIPNPRCYYPKLGANNSPDRVLGADGKKYIK